MKLRYYMRGLGIGIIVTAILLGVSFHGKNKPMTDEQVIARAKELGMEEKYENAVLAEVVSSNDATKEQPVQSADTKAKDDNAKVTETTENKQAQDALKRAEQAKDTARDTAEKTIEQTEGLAGEASKLKVGNANNTDTSKTSDKADATKESNPVKENQPEQETKPAKETKPEEETKPAKETKPEQNQTTGNAQKAPAAETTIIISGGDGSYEVAKKLQAAGVIEDSLAYDAYLCQNGYDKKIAAGKHVIKMGATHEEIAQALMTKAE